MPEKRVPMRIFVPRSLPTKTLYAVLGQTRWTNKPWPRWRIWDIMSNKKKALAKAKLLQRYYGDTQSRFSVRKLELTDWLWQGDRAKRHRIRQDRTFHLGQDMIRAEGTEARYE